MTNNDGYLLDFVLTLDRALGELRGPQRHGMAGQGVINGVRTTADGRAHLASLLGG